LLHPSLLSAYLKFREEAMAGAAALREVTVLIEGMHCGSCIRRVTQAIAGAGPFEVEEVRLGAARFAIPENADPAPAVAALIKAGFTARVDG
jgi:copper chaperone CopZ